MTVVTGSTIIDTEVINSQVRLAELEQRNRALEAELEQLRVYKDYAYTDMLTEVPNRRFYHERLIQETARVRRSRHQLGLALLDLDYFKEINDQIGHRAGDQVLKFFAQFLRVNLRQEDMLCRIGGDEFAVILPDTDADHAGVYFDRVKAKLDQIDLSLDGRSDVKVSFSCGIASFASEYSTEDFVEQADHALYSAKARGRNQVCASSVNESLVSRFVN
jgi:diguanylate cyclase (GGDEF)-like protein